MLDELIGNYLDALSERELDAPLMALMRAQGYFDIHFLHGPFEFGKDIIAKGTDEAGRTIQYALQSKAGNLRAADWRVVQGQVDTLRVNGLGHPSFDRSLPRQAVLVTTGRFVGGAGTEIQEYNRYLTERGEAPVDTWDRERLVELFLLHPHAGLSLGPRRGDFMAVAASIDTGEVDQQRLERHSRGWMQPDPNQLLQASLEAAVLTGMLRTHQRLDLAAYLALSLVRSASATTKSLGSEGSRRTAVEVGTQLFVVYAEELFGRLRTTPRGAIEFYRELREPGFTPYRVACSRILEIVGMLALADPHRVQVDPDDVGEWLREFCRSQPGAREPISDHYAVSMIPAILAVYVYDRELAQEVLLDTIAWVCDRHMDGLPGLATEWATPRTEVEYLVGSTYEHVDVRVRRDSKLAAVILDLMSTLEMKDAYVDAWNDVRAAELYPSIVEVPDADSQFKLDGAGLAREFAQYADTWLGPSSQAPHQRREPEREMVADGQEWALLATEVVLRDRWFISAWRGVLARYT